MMLIEWGCSPCVLYESTSSLRTSLAEFRVPLEGFITTYLRILNGMDWGPGEPNCSAPHTVCQSSDRLVVGAMYGLVTSHCVLGPGLLDNGKRDASYSTTGSTGGNLGSTGALTARTLHDKDVCAFFPSNVFFYWIRALLSKLNHDKARSGVIRS
jgi:hypothetical protein